MEGSRKNRKHHAANLGVAEDAGTRTIRRAFRKQAQLRHPDKHGGTPDANHDFQSLLESYEYLLSRPYRPPAPTPAPAAAPPKRAPSPPEARPKGDLSVLGFAAVIAAVLIGAAVFLALPREAPKPEAARGKPIEPAIRLPASDESKPVPASQLLAPGLAECSVVAERVAESRKKLPSPRIASRTVCGQLCELWLAGLQPEGGTCTWGAELVATIGPRRETPPPPATAVAPPREPVKRKSSKFLQALLLSSAHSGDGEAVREALDQGADIDAASASSLGHTALEVAMLMGRREVFLLLLQRGASVNQVNGDGETPLMFCAVHRVPMSFVKALVNPGGADLLAVNAEGRTAEDLAWISGYQELGAYLRSPEAEEDSRAARERRESR